MGQSIVGEWAQDKLDRLRKYLHAYTTIMQKQNWCHGFHYVDAFAGPGIHQIRQREISDHADSQKLFDAVAEHGLNEEQKQFIVGSPKVALDIQFPFSTYTFLERSTDRATALNELRVEYGKRRQIEVVQTDCRNYLQNVLPRQRNWQENRAVVFLDPFGMQVDWSMIDALARTKAIEIFVNFPVGMAIQRLLPRQPDKITAAQRAMLDNYFGTSDWYNAVYRKKDSLFEEEDEKIEKSGEALLRWYRGRLNSIFKHVSHATLIRNSQKGHLYYLLMASHNRIGVKIANDILSAGEVVK